MWEKLKLLLVNFFNLKFDMFGFEFIHEFMNKRLHIDLHSFEFFTFDNDFIVEANSCVTVSVSNLRKKVI
jgi:hypothetical protein